MMEVCLKAPGNTIEVRISAAGTRPEDKKKVLITVLRDGNELTRIIQKSEDFMNGVSIVCAEAGL